MLSRHRDRVAVIGGHLVQVCDALGERGAIGHGEARAILGHGEHCDWPTSGGQQVHALIPAL